MLASAKLPLLYSLRLQNRQRRQNEFIAMVKTYRSAEELEPRMARWLIEWEEGASAEYRRLSDLHREMYIQMLLELDRSLTPAQRVRAVTRLNDYAEVFALLARQNKPARPGS